MFGQTDAVPGLFYVHTRFFHVDFCPLFPRQSYLVLELQGEMNRALEIPTHGKSIWVAWIRFLSVVFSIVAAIMCFIPMDDDFTGSPLPYYIPVLPALFLLNFAIRGKKLQNASYESASKLCAGLDPELGARLQSAVDRKFNRSEGVVMAEAVPLDEDDEMDAFVDEEAVEITEPAQPYSKTDIS